MGREMVVMAGIMWRDDCNGWNNVDREIIVMTGIMWIERLL